MSPYSYQSINQTSIAPIYPAKPGSVARQPNQCSTAKSRKQFRNINRPWGNAISMGERPNQRYVSSDINHWQSQFRPTGPPFTSLSTDEASMRKCLAYGHKPDSNPLYSNCESEALATRPTRPHHSHWQFKSNVLQLLPHLCGLLWDLSPWGHRSQYITFNSINKEYTIVNRRKWVHKGYGTGPRLRTLPHRNEVLQCAGCQNWILVDQPDREELKADQVQYSIWQIPLHAFAIWCAPSPRQVPQGSWWDVEWLRGVAGIVYRHSKDQDANLWQVLRRSREGALNPEKCTICVQSESFFWKPLDCRWSEARSKKSSHYEDEPPANKAELQTILGKVNYSARFTLGLSETTAPLWEMLEGANGSSWESQWESTFQKIKDVITQEPGLVLAYFEQKKEVTLQGDASRSGLGTTLIEDDRSFEAGAMVQRQRVSPYVVYCIMSRGGLVSPACAPKQGTLSYLLHPWTGM